MTSIKDKLFAVFQAAERLNATLWKEAIDSSAMSVQVFADHIRDEWGISVEFKLLDVETNLVYGYIERYDGGNRAVIHLAEHLGPRWRRLVGVKELCQVVLDGREDFSTDAEDTLARLVTQVLELDHPENLAVRSELAAETLAFELLYPHELRKQDLERIKRGEVSVTDLAEKYSIPTSMAEEVLSATYMQFAERWWRTIVEVRGAAQ